MVSSVRRKEVPTRKAMTEVFFFVSSGAVEMYDGEANLVSLPQEAE